MTVEQMLANIDKAVSSANVDVGKVVRLELSLAVWAHVKLTTKAVRLPSHVINTSGAFVGHYSTVPVRVRYDLQPGEWAVVVTGR